MKTQLTIAISIIAMLAWAGCAQDAEETDLEVRSIQEALETENGGFDSEDSDPLFGEEPTFADVGLEGEDEPLEDPELIHGPDGRPAEGPRVATVLVLWGQMRLNPEIERPRRWDGMIATNAGALVVRRVVRFEGPTDTLLPRPDRMTVPFTSATAPHNDGLILSVVRPPEGENEIALLNEVVIALDGLEEIRIPADALQEGVRMAIPVDDMGNMVVITTVPEHPCPNGMLAGVWRHLRPDAGRFFGRWVGLEGEVHGHVQGIFGVNEAGQQVFFGKYIGNDGRFRGLLRGHYGRDLFVGHWIGLEGRTMGGLSGHLADNERSEQRGDGFFAGRWVEACGAAPCEDGLCPGEDPTIIDEVEEETELDPELY